MSHEATETLSSRLFRRNFPVIVALMEKQEQDIATLTAERDAAIAHDRQPYPTAWAYEQVCKARTELAERLDEAKAERDALRTALEGTPPLSVWVGCQYGLQPDVDAITDWMRLKIEALGGKS